MPKGDESRGLYGKYIVARADREDRPGYKHDGCTYFVLDLMHDKNAPPALRAYADSCEAEYPMLAADLREQATTLERYLASEAGAALRQLDLREGLGNARRLPNA